MLETCKLVVFPDDDRGGRTLLAIRVRDDGDQTVLDSIAEEGSESLLLADCRGAEDLQRFDMALSVAEARAGRVPGSIRIIAGVGSAAGLLRLAELGGKSARLRGLAWNRAAFCAEMQCAEDSPMAGHARMQVTIAARAFGLPAYDVSQEK